MSFTPTDSSIGEKGGWTEIEEWGGAYSSLLSLFFLPFYLYSVLTCCLMSVSNCHARGSYQVYLT